MWGDYLGGFRVIGGEGGYLGVGKRFCGFLSCFFKGVFEVFYVLVIGGEGGYLGVGNVFSWICSFAF